MSNESLQTAEILCVGTELLLGDIVNTNAAYLSRRLAELGISVYHQSVVGDHPGRLREALRLALSRADLIITSGGLGPTYDDLTKETVAETLGLPLETDPATLERIRTYFASTCRVMTANNQKQALIPAGATVFENNCGTAPGLAIPVPGGSQVVILLPGPPRELEPMFARLVYPYLQRRSGSMLRSLNLSIYGMGESAVEDVLRDRMVQGTNPTIAPYCKSGEVRLRITAKAATEEEALAMCRTCAEEIRKTAVGPYIYGIIDARDGEYLMEMAVLSHLLETGQTVACAESCTGGLITKRLTDLPGSSAVVCGGCVTYTNHAKTELLGVSPETIRRYTEVSEQTAAEMARGIRLRLGTDIGLSTTGYAGPGGGTPQNPIGTVYVGISTSRGEFVSRLSLSSQQSRDYIRTVAATHAMSLVLRSPGI